MRTSFFVVLAFALAYGMGAVCAQPTMGAMPGYAIAAPPCGGYQGPGDVQTTGWKAYYGFRAFSCAQALAGVAAIDLCAQADTTCAAPETEHVNSTGGLTLGTIGTACNFVANICRIYKFHDMVGSGAPDLLGATVANSAQFKPSCINSLPCAHFIKASSLGNSGVWTGGGAAQPISLYWAADRTGTASQSGVFCLQNGTDLAPCDYFNTANSFFLFAGTVRSITAADNAWHVESSVYNNATMPGAILDGTATTLAGSPGATGANANLSVSIGRNQQGSNYMDGDILEGGWLIVALTSGQGAALNTNAKTYYPALP